MLLSYSGKSYNNATITSRSVAIIGTSVVTAISVSSMYWIYQNVSKYGWAGMLRYIWEGDQYPPHVRLSVDTLDEVERSLPKQEVYIDYLEESLARAKLNTVDGAAYCNNTSNNSSDSLLLRPVWIQLYAPRGDLRKDLAYINSILDKLAAKIDTVLTHSEQHVKVRKKAMSQTVVHLMERVDVLLANYGIDS